MLDPSSQRRRVLFFRAAGLRAVRFAVRVVFFAVDLALPVVFFADDLALPVVFFAVDLARRAGDFRAVDFLRPVDFLRA